MSRISANLIERTPLLGGYTLYTFQSPTNPLYLYRVLCKDGIADPTTHSDCVAFKRHGDCAHMQSIIAHETDHEAAYDATTGSEAAHKVIDMGAVLAAKVARRYAEADLEAFDKQETTEYPIVRTSSSRWGLELD